MDNVDATASRIETLPGLCTFPEGGVNVRRLSIFADPQSASLCLISKKPAANLVSQSETNVIAPNTRTPAASIWISAALKPANIGTFDMGTFSVPDTAG